MSASVLGQDCRDRTETQRALLNPSCLLLELQIKRESRAENWGRGHEESAAEAKGICSIEKRLFVSYTSSERVIKRLEEYAHALCRIV